MNIGIYGLTNVGKSTLVNFLCGQNVSIVSSVEGTTTDPVRRRFEIFDYAPVTFIDTAGLDDNTELGHKRMQKTMETLEVIDLALFLTFDKDMMMDIERNFLMKLGDVPIIIIERKDYPEVAETIFDKIRKAVPAASLVEPDFYGGRVMGGDKVVLVCPIDSEAPSGRMILPQVQAIRAALDLGAVVIVVQPSELAGVMEQGDIRLVVTDSQVFDVVKKIVGDGVELTSFSILLADLKGDKVVYAEGLKKLGSLKKGDKVMVIENCSHQVSCEDIGRVKIPMLLDKFVGGALEYDFIVGRDGLPDELGRYAFAVQCGGCMTTRKHLQNRIRRLGCAGVAVTNYGLLLRTLLISNT